MKVLLIEHVFSRLIYSIKYLWNLDIWLNKLNNKHLDLNHGTYPLRLDLNEKRY